MAILIDTLVFLAVISIAGALITWAIFRVWDYWRQR